MFAKLGENRGQSALSDKLQQLKHKVPWALGGLDS